MWATKVVFTKGKSWSSGGIDFEVLHPPEAGPSGNENTRSMVIEVGYKGFKMLLTGDFRLRRQGEISNPIKGSNQGGVKE